MLAFVVKPMGYPGHLHVLVLFIWISLALALPPSVYPSPSSVSTQAFSSPTSWTLPDTCLSLSTSQLCPAFQSQYVDPSELSDNWPFFDQVAKLLTSSEALATNAFDQGLREYLEGDWAKEKLYGRSSCQNYDVGHTIQWTRTLLCGEFTAYSSSCYEGGASTKMPCQSTCSQFASSERSSICPLNPALLAQHPQEQLQTLTSGFTCCTNPETDNTATCIEGFTNEPNCGFGSNTNQLCNYCSPHQQGDGLGPPDACCNKANTDLSQCGYVLSPRRIETSPVIEPGSDQPTSSSSGYILPAKDLAAAAVSQENHDKHRKWTDREIASVVVGSVVGGLLFLLALAALVFFLRRRRHRNKGGSLYIDPGRRLSSISGEKMRTSQGSGMGKHGQPVFRLSASSGGALKEKTPKQMLPAAEGLSPRWMANSTRTRSTSNPSSRDRSDVNLDSSKPETTNSGQSVPCLRPRLDSNSGLGNSSGPVVSSYLDPYSQQTVLPGSVVIVLYPYEADLPDELDLIADKKVKIITMFNDGWAVGRPLKDIDDAGGPTWGRIGAFPLVCVTAQDPPTSISSASPTLNVPPPLGSDNNETASEWGQETEELDLRDNEKSNSSRDQENHRNHRSSKSLESFPSRSFAARSFLSSANGTAGHGSGGISSAQSQSGHGNVANGEGREIGDVKQGGEREWDRASSVSSAVTSEGYTSARTSIRGENW